MKTKELRKPKDSTRLLLDRIISWEKNLNEYPSLESILREQFIIYEREEGAGFINGMFKKLEALEAERSELIEYNNNLEKTLRICLTVKPHTESVDTMRAMIKTLLENSLKK